MENKTKFVLIGLAAILLVSLVINFQITGVKQQVTRERDELKRENNALLQKMEVSLSESRQLENRIAGLTSDLNSLNEEKAELEKKFELVSRERQELANELKEQKKAPAISAMQGSLVPVGEDAYWAGILKAKTDLEMQLDNVRNELKSVQITNEELQRERNSLTLEVQGLVREKQDLKRQMDYNQKLMDALAQELVREKNDKFQIEETFKTIKSENISLRRQLKGLDSRKISLEVKLAGLQKENTSLGNRIKEMEEMLEAKSLQMDSLKYKMQALEQGKPVAEKEKESVELPPIVVRPKPQQPPAAVEAPSVASSGKILAINRDNNFVIIDSGADQGIKTGDLFSVYRNDEAIANIEVIQSREKISACDIKKEKSPIKVGDIVR